MSDDRELVQMLLTAAGLPASAEEVAQMTELQVGIRQMVANIRAVPGVSAEWPTLIFDPRR